ncbi:hypothetical protein PILCRDRAFT_12127 [Piloderma croceum F 1598]|uniref:Uncharacterized protein n=1 Tax=Piloderma croceum (strain F 1598) TaxID=765440 RepID=A0A0C3EXQ2_PILCF|nr:hypothetical protein PILCRDRAFT_12127 [Piloderma croceum F 1598]
MRNHRYRAALDLADFPASFSVLLKNEGSKTPNRNVRKPAELEQYVMEVMDSHAMRVNRWGLGSRAEVKSDILAGMWRTWRAVSQLSVNHS